MPFMLNKTLNSNIKTNILVAILLLFPLSYFYIKDLNFFVSDIGLRYLQITQLIEHQWQTFAIDYPLRFVDPTFEHVSYYRAYGILEDDLYFFISPFFPLLVSFLYLWLGSAGLPIIPVVGGVTAAWGTYKLAEVSKLRYPLLAFWGTILATPVLFYSLVLWDHTLATALTTLAVYGVVKGIEQERQSSIVWGGIALGLAVNQRPEAYTFTIALGIALLILSWPKWQAPIALTIGGLVGALPLWIWQYFWFGHPLGMAMAPNLFGYSVPEEYPFPDPLVVFTPLQQRLWFLVHIQQNSALSLIIAMSLLIGTGTIILALRSVRRSGKDFLLLGFSLSMIGYLMVSFISLFGAVKGLISTFPLASLSLTYLDDHQLQNKQRKIYLLIFVTVLMFLCLTFVLWPVSGGLQWGARYLLLAQPLLLYLSLHVYGQISQLPNPSWQAKFRATTMTLLALSVILQLLSVNLLHQSRTEQLATQDLVNSLEADIILTNVGHASSFLASISDKDFLYVRDDKDLAIVLQALAENEIEKVAVIGNEALTVPQSVTNVTIEQISEFVYRLQKNKQ